MPDKPKTSKGVLSLLLLAPFLGEVVSTSAPPAEFFQPFTLITLTMLYGCGALLVREAVRRKGKGWGSIFLLGLAYGIYEEGIVVRSFFDPTWQDLGLLAQYGRWLGVNWIWTFELMLFHAVVSISLPILLVELAFPEISQMPWLSRRGVILSSLAFLSLLLFAPFFSQYFSLPALLACLLAIGLLVRWGLKLPSTASQPETDIPSPTCRRVGGRAFLFSLAFFLLSWIFPALNLPVLLTATLMVSLPFLAKGQLKRLAYPAWTRLHYWALAFGILVPWLVVDVLAEFDNPNRPDDTTGMLLVALFTLLGLLWLRRRILKADKRGDP